MQFPPLPYCRILQISIRWPTGGANECIGAPCETWLAREQVEAGTPFGRWHDAGRLRLPTDDEGAAMYSDASRMLLEVLPSFLRSHCARLLSARTPC